MPHLRHGRHGALTRMVRLSHRIIGRRTRAVRPSTRSWPAWTPFRITGAASGPQSWPRSVRHTGGTTADDKMSQEQDEDGSVAGCPGRRLQRGRGAPLGSGGFPRLRDRRGRDHQVCVRTAGRTPTTGTAGRSELPHAGACAVVIGPSRDLDRQGHQPDCVGGGRVGSFLKGLHVAPPTLIPACPGEQGRSWSPR